MPSDVAEIPWASIPPADDFDPRRVHQECMRRHVERIAAAVASEGVIARLDG
jgi:hypothetical protein